MFLGGRALTVVILPKCHLWHSTLGGFCTIFKRTNPPMRDVPFVINFSCVLEAIVLRARLTTRIGTLF